MNDGTMTPIATSAVGIGDSPRQYRAGDLIALTFSPTDDAGAPLAVVDPATATVSDGAGVQIAAGSAAVSGGIISYTLEGSGLPLDTYTVTWTGVVGGIARTWTSEFELVGGFILTPADIRAYNPAFADVAKFSDAVLAQCRDEIEEILETNGMCAFRPRGQRVVLDGNGAQKLLLPDTDVIQVYSIAADGVALTADELALVIARGNVLYRGAGTSQAGFWPRGFANIAIHYAYGYARVPLPIRKAALILAKERVVPTSQLPARATATTVGDQTYRITIAGRDGYTGIPDVDSAIDQFGRHRPRMA